MKYVPARHYTPANRKTIDLVVIHTAECGESANAAENLQSWTAGPNASQASWHYAVDSDSVTQSVLEKDISWHAGPANGFSIGVEHAGKAGQTTAEWDDDFSKATLAMSSKLVADICLRYGIPARRLSAEDLARGERRGICGHVDVTKGMKSGSHWDPGPNFPWDAYLAKVREEMLALTETRPAPEVFVPPPPIMNAKPGEPGPNFDTFAEMELDVIRGGKHFAETWLVAPIYFAPVSIGQARDTAAKLGCELPTPALVDAIWRAADLKIDASKMTRSHDGTLAQMDSWEVHENQALRIAAAVGDRSLGVDFKVLAGTHKDVVVQDGRIGLYGWHRANGTVIQPFFAGHALAWRDYSQGLRLVRRKA